ncbi:MAG: pantetheine-phosphate adenylyltransferase [Oscillospiraceae bacterium]|jgi:pantetheine-phosphate adenylyltransferase|nr:pantetheine-phosphate adenylyltransferase [Oscillospiraceae bacterium]
MKVIVPGSFDPVTLGHVDLFERASKMFDEVVAAILINPNKAGWMPTDDRMRLVSECVSHLQNVSVLSWNGLLAKLAVDERADAIVRGLRCGAEFEAEYPYAMLNEKLSGVETIFIASNPTLAVVSSSGVRELALFGSVPQGIVPEPVKEYIDNMQPLAATYSTVRD